ncbi:MAG: hypothetical protein JXX28_01870 [Deltaproteobacteria bacterium]|nr:hypothetical protein [Deltaproteobacteria bacterium]
MARSLSVKHEEEASTNPLFNTFLVISALWLALSAVGGAFQVTPSVAAEVAPAQALP